MQPKIDRTAIVNIPCPTCGEKIAETVGELERGPRLRCPKCGVSIQVDAQKIMQKIRAAAAKVAESGRGFGN